MPNPTTYDPHGLDSLLEQLSKPQVAEDLLPSREGLDQHLFEFLGQAAWGAAAHGSWGVVEIADIAAEAVTDKQNILEKFVTSIPAEILTAGKSEDNYAGDFSASDTDIELGLPGKIGYTVGSMYGMIKSLSLFKYGPQYAAKGLAWAGTKLGIGKATKDKALQLAQDDILESIGQIVYKAGQKEGAQELTEKEAGRIAKESLDIISKGGVRAQGAREWGDAAFQISSRQAIKHEVLRKTFGPTVDDKLLDEFAKETLEVMMRRTPDEARNIVDNAALDLMKSITGAKTLAEMPKAARVAALTASASSYEAMMGVTIGAVRGLGEYLVHDHYDWNKPESLLGHVVDVATHEGIAFSMFGPLRFIKGGSRISALKKTKDMTRGVVNQLKPINKMTTKEMSANIELLHVLSKDGITGVMDNKWLRHGKWWRDADKRTDKKKAKAELQEFLKEARRTFLKDAPGLFARELGADMFQSLPRMLTGAVVMNLSSLKEAIDYYGPSGILEGLGQTDYEKFSNLFVSMYFTRQPHSFHLPGQRYKGPFESKAIKNFASQKSADFSRAVTGLNLIGGKNFETSVKIANQYGGFSDKKPTDLTDELYSKSFEGSEEVQKIKEAVDPHTVDKYKTPPGEEAAGDLHTAGAKFIAEDVKDPGEKAEWRDKLTVAKNIIKWHDANSERVKLISPTLTKTAAKNLIERLSSIKFDGKTITSTEPIEQLHDWYATRVEREGGIALDMVKDYVVQSYRALGVPNVAEVDGIIRLPRLDQSIHGEYINSLNISDGSRSSGAEVFVSLQTATKNLEKIGIVKISNEVHDTASAEMIKNTVDIKAETVDKMMQYVHGPAKGTKVTDEAIIRSPVWYVTHNRMAETAQRANTEYVLKGSGEGSTSLDTVKAKQLNKHLKEELAGERFPDLSTKDGEIMTDVDIDISSKSLPELADAIVDMKRVHRLMSLVTPEQNINPPTKIRPERLLEIHSQWKRMLGEVVSDPDIYSRMQYELIRKSIRALGISGISGKYNMDAAIHDLVMSRPFNTELGMRIPEVSQVNDMVAALETKITPESRTDMIEFYDRVVAALKNANMGSIKVVEMTEQAPGEWYEAIKGAMTRGRSTASRFATERVLDVMKRAEELGDDIDFYGLELVASAAHDEASSRESRKLQDRLSTGKAKTQLLVEQLKRGIESGDGLILHAYADRADKMVELLKAAKNADVTGRQNEFLQKTLELAVEGMSTAKKDGWTELTVREEAVKKMEQMNVPERDRHDIGIKVSASQFAQKYDISMDKMTNMFLSYRSMERTVKESAESIMDILNAIPIDMKFNEKLVYDESARREINKVKRHVDQVIRKGGTPDPNKFWDDIVKPLMVSIEMKQMERFVHLPNNEPLEGWGNFREKLRSDISSITSSYFSSMPVKVYNYRNGQLTVGEKQMGYTEKYGAQGIIAALNNSPEISVLSGTFYIDGNYVTQPSRLQMSRIIQELSAGVEVSYENGFRQYLAEPEKIAEQRLAQGKDTESLNTQKFTVISADESTLILVRRSADNLIQKDLLAAYQKSSVDHNGDRLNGGHLYERLQASLETNRAGEVIYPSEMKDLIDRINRNELTNEDIHDAIQITRILNDRPSLIHKWMTLTPKQRKKDYKYLKLSELKGGFVGHEENLARVRSFLEGAAKEDPFYSKVLGHVRDFLPSDKNAKFPKLKLVSVADEMVHADGKINIFSAIDYKKAELLEMKENEIIDPQTYDQNIRALEKVTKSVVDGSTYLSLKAYVSSLAMMGGLTPETIRFREDGSIEEIKIGAIKPTISHTDVKTDLNDPSYGRVKEFYAKTAFHYDPIFDGLFHSLGVDGIIFNSSNKINEFRNSQGEDFYNTNVETPGQMRKVIDDGGRNVHATFRGLDNVSQLPTDYDGRAAWLGNNIEASDFHIHHIPFESINLRSLGIPHDPLVGSNISVHMHDHLGIRDWIKLDSKIDKVYSAFDNIVDPYYATKLAKELFAHSAESGDTAWLNTGIDHFLKHDGLLTAPWQRKMIEDKIIPYYMNNGMIAAGRVNEGSLDIMSPDLGGLRTTVTRERRDGVKVAQYFGEFVQSKHSAEKTFKAGGETDRKDVRSVIIQRIDYAGSSKDNVYEDRKADAFFVNRGKEKLLVVEGSYLDSEGNRRSLYDNKTMKYIGPTNTIELIRARNKFIYKDALEKENDFLKTVNVGTDNYSQVMTKLFKYDKANPGRYMALGSLNNRQPRNQAGDVVISRLKVREQPGNRIITHNGDLRGNSSRMNHADAINPQDSDYDMDKSSAFLAAPNNLWAEAARLAGYRVVNDIKDLEVIYEKFYSTKYPAMFNFEPEGADPFRYGQEMNATALNRGRFVKLHQSLTYLHNMFRDNPVLMTVRNPFATNELMQVRLNRKETSIVNTQEMISKNVKLFLDLYAENPKYNTENPEKVIRDIMFGFKYGDVTHEGMFELVNPETNTVLNVKHQNLRTSNKVTERIKDDIYYNLLSPLSKYLRYNKGTTIDESNQDVAATLGDYQRANQQLLYAIDPSDNNINYTREYSKGTEVVKYDNTSMFKAANDFIADSFNPFDVAMRGLHRYGNNGHGFEERRVGTKEILDYVMEGNVPEKWNINIPEGLEHEFLLNKVAGIAMGHLGNKTGEIVRLEQLATNIQSIRYKLEELDSYGGGKRGGDIKETMQYRNLTERKIRMEELKATIEENLSYNKNNVDNEKVYNGATKEKRTEQGEFQNREFKPIVVVTKEGKTKEVILPNRRNFKPIHWSDTLVLNGHRYEIMDGVTQLGLRAEFRAFGGVPHFVLNKKNGDILRLLPGEEAIVNDAYKELNQSIKDLYRMTDGTKPSINEYAAKKTGLILDKLEHIDFAFNPARQMALIFRMLRPNWDPKVSPIIPVRYTNKSKTSVVGNVKFTENRLAKSVYNTLAQIANGSVDTIKGANKGGIDKNTASEILRDLVSLHRSYYAQEMSGKEVNMNKLEKVGYTEPTELPHGYMTDARFLDKRVFDRMRDGSEMQRKAAGTLYKWLSSQALVDNATLYKASKEMEAGTENVPGIPVNEQFMMKVYDPASDTYKNSQLRNFGIMDAYRSTDRGQGGVIRDKGSRTVKEVWSCLNITGI